jgi:hypothetical protein
VSVFYNLGHSFVLLISALVLWGSYLDYIRGSCLNLDSDLKRSFIFLDWLSKSLAGFLIFGTLVESLQD